MNEPALWARGLRKSYGALEVVAGVDLSVAPGECFGLLGPNGAGKTTTLKLCLGLTAPDAGEIRLLGQPVPATSRAAAPGADAGARGTRPSRRGSAV